MNFIPTRVALIGLLMLLAPAARAETRAFFSSQESVEEELTRLIEHSRSSIDIALFELKSPSLVRALERARGRGVALRLVLDASHRGENLSVGGARWLAGRRDQSRGLMHNKFALFDHARLVTGSYNWTPGAEHSNYENALLTDDEGAVKAYAGEFERLWERASEHPPAQSRTPSHFSSSWSKMKRKTPHPSRKKAYRQTSAKSVRIRVLRLVPPKL